MNISDYHFLVWIDSGIIPLHKNLLLERYTYRGMAGRSQACSYIGYGAVTIVVDRQAWQLYTKTFPDNSFFDSVYLRALETFVLSFFSIDYCSRSSVLAAY